ncbi:OPT family oligopeptide transporter [Caulobacter sp. S45]|uniref:OPT family oligopeptide transporter n=1 Tax=Caulobacter sp. S45 TaxID=1641861 RepID=UPI001576D350|nr:oligopeptide transporter, OPT family [Caulobacter sp. S45]
MTLAAAAPVPAVDARVELTIRGLILGGLITLVFTAANVYLGLKVGLTFASSIPAAVISMAVLRMFRSTSIFENNIVQTVASAAGTLSSIIFVLPGLVMVGWWSGHIPFWQTFAVCAVGGVLGVMYTIPLRRALVTESDLPYPEGVAAAEVLKVGVGSRAHEAKAAAEGRAGLMAVLWGAIASGGFAVIAAMKLFASEAGAYFRIGQGATGLNLSLSFALLGAGHLVGLQVGMAMLVGLVFSWGVAVPLLTNLHPHAGAAADLATSTWSHQVRFIGAGAIGASSLWTLGKLGRPVIGGIRSSLAASAKTFGGQGADLPRTERDIPLPLVGLICLLTLAPLAALLTVFLHGGPLAALTVPLVAGAVLYIVVAGFLVAAVCGFMAGLIGSSNSPVSGLAILAVLGAGVLLLVLAGHAAGPGGQAALVAFALFVTAILLSVATIANDNLQDLKTGQLVDATPWRQQVALVVGVFMGSLVIPPVIDLLNRAYGFAGASHFGHATLANALPAPQATLISALAKGVITGQLDWSLIGVGVLVGIVLIVADEALRASKRGSVPPLAVGLGIYLPSSTTAFVVVGAVCGWLYDRWAERLPNREGAKRLGVLLASGLIVGESLWGVALAGLIVATGRGEPLAVVGDGFAKVAVWVGLATFAAITAGLYRWISGVAQRQG